MLDPFGSPRKFILGPGFQSDGEVRSPILGPIRCAEVFT